MAVDDQYTISLLHFDKDFSDENTNNVWIASGCTIDKTQPKFGEGCLHIQPSGTLRCQNPQFAFGTGDFTIDFWMYSVNGSGGFSSSNSVDGIMFNADMIAVGNIGLGVLPLQNPFLVKQWAHYAVVRKANTIYCFVNGILIKSGQFTPQAIAVSTLVINARYVNNNDYNGGENYYDEFRISNVARWTSSFTPPTKPNSPGVSVNPPTNLSAAAGDSQVTLLWTGASSIAGYNVKRSTTAGGSYTTIASNVTGTSYVDTAVTNGIAYYYVVTAVDSSGNESANSNEASAMPMAPVQTEQELLRVTMIDSSEREYELSVFEIDGFISWYNSAISTGKPCFMLNKKVGSQNSKEYLAFEKIISFEVTPLTK